MFVVIRKRHLVMAAGFVCFLCGMAAVLWQGSPMALPSFASGGAIAPPTVIIDPGHGGEDGGAVASDGTIESTLNLEISLRLNDLLRFLGYQTQMTRRENISIHSDGTKTLHERKVSDLNNRVAMVNAEQNAILLSIHQNKLPSVPSVHGAQAFYNHVEQAGGLAKTIQTTLNETINAGHQKSEKKIASTIYLMKNVTAPAVLVECGFLSNAEETAQLHEREHQLRLATAIAAGCRKGILTEEELE